MIEKPWGNLGVVSSLHPRFVWKSFRHFIATSFGNPFAASSPLRWKSFHCYFTAISERLMLQDDVVFLAISSQYLEKMDAA